MKKILCFTLAFLLSFNAITCNVLAEDFSGSSTDYNTPSKDTLKELPADAPSSTETFLKHVYFQPMTEFFNSIGIDIWGDNKVWNEDTSKFILENAAKDNNVTTDGNYYYINANFIKNINQKVQENMHALDGYWLIETSGTPPFIDNGASFINYCTLVANFRKEDSILSSAKDNTSLADASLIATFTPADGAKSGNGVYDSYYAIGKDYTGFDSKYYMVLDSSNYAVCSAIYDSHKKKASYMSNHYLGSTWFNYLKYYKFTYTTNLTWTIEQLQSRSWSGSPFRVFYSLEDLARFKANGGRQYYAPQLPIANIVDSLNQIKALLVADTVLDVFRNRSNETANKAKEKFPTSLPWDIALVVNAFSAPPKEPVIELPIKIESMHIDEKIVVDLSSEEWVKLAKTCRYLLSILFVLYMVHLSRKFFSKGDD